MYDFVYCEIWKDKLVWCDEKSVFRREIYLNVVVYFIVFCEYCFGNYDIFIYNYMYDKINYIDCLYIILGILIL